MFFYFYRFRRIEDAKQELSSSDLFSSVTSSLREAIALLNKPQINEIICFGIGRIGECLISRYQFALLLLLRDVYVENLLIYDPILSKNDTTILQHFKCTQLVENCEGKYNVAKTTLFYMPHCPKQLSNNLLWSNWGLNLTHCLILSNSFNTIVENTTKRLLHSNAFYITKILPYCTELPVINTFKFYEIFNDTALHIFPNLHLISDDLWVENSEPDYIDEDIEFIRKTN